MEAYKTPEMEIVLFDAEDVITTSGVNTGFSSEDDSTGVDD
jgi:hypothetical protein